MVAAEPAAVVEGAEDEKRPLAVKDEDSLTPPAACEDGCWKFKEREGVEAAAPEVEGVEGAGCELAAGVVAEKRAPGVGGSKPGAVCVPEVTVAGMVEDDFPRLGAAVAKEKPGDDDTVDAGCVEVKLKEKLAAGAAVDDKPGAEVVEPLKKACDAAVEV